MVFLSLSSWNAELCSWDDPRYNGWLLLILLSTQLSSLDTLPLESGDSFFIYNLLFYLYLLLCLHVQNSLPNSDFSWGGGDKVFYVALAVLELTK